MVDTDGEAGDIAHGVIDLGHGSDTGVVSSGDDPKHLSIDLQPLPTGSYDVHWNAISGDGHRVKGSFSFEVKYVRP